MRKVLHFDSSPEPYRSDAAVVWCFDHRFGAAFRKLLKRIGVLRPDSIQIAGGAKSLASPAQEYEREFVLNQIRTSMRLHATDRVVLMLHSDCGGYGGLAAFNNTEAEARHHQEELRRAAAWLREKIPGLPVQCYFLNFEGVWEVDRTTTAS